MDGITALPKILEARPGTSIIIASTLSQRNAEISLQALALGAADYVPKPVASRLGSNEEFRRELLDKVRPVRQSQPLAPAAQRDAARQYIRCRQAGCAPP